MRRLFLSLGLVFGLLTFAHSESYKYRDSQGRLVITNDLNQVPPDQRPGAKEKNLPETQAGSNQRGTAPFEGRVVKVLDGQTVQVLRQGTPVTVRVRDIPTHVSKERIHELVGQQTVTVIVYDRTAEGRLIGEVILPTGRSLSQEVAPAAVVAKPAEPREPIVSSPMPQASRPKTLGVSYDQMMQYLAAMFQMERAPPRQGYERYLGKRPGGAALIELLGAKDDLSEAALMVFFPRDDPKIFGDNTAILIRFMKNALPEWVQGGEWVTNAVKKLAASPHGTAEEMSYMYLSICFFIVLSWPFAGVEQGKK